VVSFSCLAGLWQRGLVVCVPSTTDGTLAALIGPTGVPATVVRSALRWGRHLAATPHPSYLMVNFQQIDVDTDGRARLDAAAMNLCHNDFLCPVCSKPMRLLTTIRRMPGEQTLVLQCKPCGLSTTKKVEEPGPRDTTH
jgi:hypothetical protein